MDLLKIKSGSPTHSYSSNLQIRKWRFKESLIHLTTSCKELTHWKRPWCWEGLGAGGEGDDRGWDGWMASPTRWTWVWVNSGSWWWTGGLVCFDSWDCKELDTTEQLNWTELNWYTWWCSHHKSNCRLRRTSSSDLYATGSVNVYYEWRINKQLFYKVFQDWSYHFGRLLLKAICKDSICDNSTCNYLVCQFKRIRSWVSISVERTKEI